MQRQIQSKSNVYLGTMVAFNNISTSKFMMNWIEKLYIIDPMNILISQ